MLSRGEISLLSPGKSGYSQLGMMRRFLSITAIAALLSSMLTPLMAAACTGTGKAVSCHAVEAPSCDRPMHQHHHHAAAPVSKSALSAADDDAKCPMECCTPGHGQNGASIAAAVALPLPVVVDQGFHSTSMTFVRPGFSSHTDRGPPLA
jgi:predicted cobalt transporter CbtA